MHQGLLLACSGDGVHGVQWTLLKRSVTCVAFRSRSTSFGGLLGHMHRKNQCTFLLIFFWYRIPAARAFLQSKPNLTRVIDRSS